MNYVLKYLKTFFKFNLSVNDELEILDKNNDYIFYFELINDLIDVFKIDKDRCDEAISEWLSNEYLFHELTGYKTKRKEIVTVYVKPIVPVQHITVSIKFNDLDF